ncbi:MULTISPECIES: hypothetical protein [unclassified Fibrobacter]|uniref:hypothetical protein n=1 Tax=unclassified Fibrobacter TaxID=2634177 RepID=UPI0011B25CC6|nr:MULTISPECIES: hypothetical protein [unclassified Fibrobacter]
MIDAKDNYYGYGYGAGIGGGRYGSASVIDIKGGVIQAKGIGMATTSYGNPTCGNINIYDGVKKIIVTSKDDGKGLASSSAVTFYSGSSAVEGDEKDAVFYDVEKGGGREIRSIAKNHLVTIADVAKASVGSVAYAYAGELVTLTLGTAANESSLTVSDGTNNLELTGAGDGKYTFVMPEGDVTVTADVLQTYSISLPTGMKIIGSSIAADGNGTYMTGTKVEFKPSFPYSASNVSDGVNTLTATDGVYSVVVDGSDITITADVQRDEIIDLTRAPGAFAAINGDVLSGSTSYTVHIADGATITLSGAIINGGIVCDGSATIILERENTVKGATNMAGIQVGGEGTTLTIKGNGSLTATGYSQSAGIGLSRAWNLDYDVVGGDVVIEGGNITAQGGSYGAGIGTGILQGSDRKVTLGNITIKGGTVKAIDGKAPNGDKVANGIGTGDAYPGCTNEVGEITIYDDIVVVDASSISKDVTYMHDDIDVSASKNDYFGIIENGERKIIYTGIPAFDVEDQTYTGEAITPKPTVSLGSLNFTEGVDYEYSYSNNVNVGSSATVTVTFKGDYEGLGTVSKTFNITKGTPEVISNPTPNEEGYAGKCLALVNPGTTNFGKLLYRTLEEESFSETIPCVDKTGDYLVYYMVEEGENWEKYVPPEPILVTVELAKFKVTFVDDEGDEIISREYEYGTPAEGVDLPPENPEKADDEMYAYTFAGWSPEIQDVTGAKTYRPIYGKTRIGFGSATIAADGSWAIIDGKSSKKIDADLDAVEITGDVTLNREFVAEKPSTIVLPFGTHIDNVPGFTFYSFKGVVKENGVWKKVVFDEVDKEGDGHIYANTPYIVVAKEDVGGLIVENGVVFDLNSVRPMSSEDGIWQFVGTYDFKVWNEGDRDIGRSYGFAAEERDGARIGQFVMLGSNAYAYPMRAYLYYAGGNSGESRSMAPALFKAAPAVASIDELPESLDVVVRGEEGTTVIGTINTRTGEFRSAENRWFDLNGRYLGNKKPTVKGSYYNNGKKVIVK